MPVFNPSVSFGGPVVQAWQVVRRLAERGHAVSVVTSDLEVPISYPRNQWVERGGVRVWYSSTGFLGRRPPYWLTNATPGLRDALQDADVLYLRMGLTLLNRQASRIASRLGVPYVYNAEGCLCPRRLREKGFQKWWFLRLVERPLIRGAVALHACTAKEREDYLGQAGRAESIAIVPNGVALPSITAKDQAAAGFRQRHQIPAGAIVLYFSRLAAIKQPDVLLKAFARLPRDGAAQLVFAGPDNGMQSALERVALDANIRDRVHFVGTLSGGDKAAALSAATLFALVSRSEGLPNAALEALAHGLPCLLGDGCNLPEVAEHAAGWVTPPTVDAAAAALEEALAGDADLARMSVQARRLAAERFAMDVIVDKIVASFEQVVAS